MITIGYILLAVAVAATITITALPAAVHALAPVLVAALWAYVRYRTRAARRRDYHRHGRAGTTHHIRPTRRRRVLVALRRLASARIVIAPKARPAA